MEALKRALTLAGVPYDVAAGTVVEYQQRFIDGHAAGRNEAEIVAELDDPRKVAAQLRKSTDLVAFKETKSVPNFVRLFFSLIGLLVFNVFLIIPGIVYAALMFALYASSLAVYVAGIAVTSSSLAGVHELVLDGPIHHVVMQKHNEELNIEDDSRGRLSIQVDGDGVRIGPSSASADAVATNGTVTLGSDMDDEDRKIGALKGIGLIFGGVLLILLSMVMTRFTWLGIKRYVQLNIGMLRTA
jgi:uncharacterized membrane protein